MVKNHAYADMAGNLGFPALFALTVIDICSTKLAFENFRQGGRRTHPPTSYAPGTETLNREKHRYYLQ